MYIGFRCRVRLCSFKPHLCECSELSLKGEVPVSSPQALTPAIRLPAFWPPRDIRVTRAILWLSPSLRSWEGEVAPTGCMWVGSACVQTAPQCSRACLGT